jgi:hypothetical protein
MARVRDDDDLARSHSCRRELTAPVGSVERIVLAPDKRHGGGDSAEMGLEPPLGVALHIGRETYETAALPLSYVGASAGIGADFEQQLFARSTSNGVDARIGRHNT